MLNQPRKTMDKKDTPFAKLLRENQHAQDFYVSLPMYVKETIAERADNIHTEKDLETYANNLLQGDD